MLRSALRNTGARSILTRNLSTSPIRREAVGTVGVAPVKTAPGGFRGGIMGFLFGFSAASGLALYYLQQETKVASGLLLASVEELQQGTDKVGDGVGLTPTLHDFDNADGPQITSHLDRLQKVEKELAALKTASAQKDDVGKVRGEMKKVYDGLHLELLDMRAHVWGVEQDIQKIAKTDSIKI